MPEFSLEELQKRFNDELATWPPFKRLAALEAMQVTMSGLSDAQKVYYLMLWLGIRAPLVKFGGMRGYLNS